MSGCSVHRVEKHDASQRHEEEQHHGHGDVHGLVKLFDVHAPFAREDECGKDEVEQEGVLQARVVQIEVFPVFLERAAVLKVE